jgi:hypothetical protein
MLASQLASRRALNEIRSLVAITESTCLFLLCVLTAAQLTSCQNKALFDPSLSSTFFPLRPGYRWTYRVIDNNERISETVTDKALGRKYIKSLGTFGETVSEEWQGLTLDGLRTSTLVYVSERGYLDRLSDFGGHGVLVEERRFLPTLLTPESTWSNRLFPFVSDTFLAEQNHRISFETHLVSVPAGRFSGCMRIDTDAVYQGLAGGLHLSYIDWYAPNVGLVKASVLKAGYINWYVPNSGLIGTVFAKTGLFKSEIANVELIRFLTPQDKVRPISSK